MTYFKDAASSDEVVPDPFPLLGFPSVRNRIFVSQSELVNSDSMVFSNTSKAF